MRRLNALVLALPPDAAVWREQAYPPTTELIAVLIERQEEWSRAIFQALRNQRRVSVPQPMRLSHASATPRAGHAPSKRS